MATGAGSARRRAQPATHPTVWVGLLMAIVGLLLAMFSYTGTRIYDATYALVALGGGVLALAGILVAAWGRALGAARAQRARRGLAAKPAPLPEATPAEAPPEKADRRMFAFRKKAEPTADAPTVAAPSEKKRTLALPALPKLGRRGAKKDEGPATMFAFRRRDQENATPTAGADTPAAIPSPDAEAPANGALVRVTMRCPRCATEFTAEGEQTASVTCPQCGLAGSV